MRDLAWDASIQYRFGADGVLWAFGMCQYCRWAQWKYRAGSGTSRLKYYCPCIYLILFLTALTSACGKFFSTCSSRQNATHPKSTKFPPNAVPLFIYLVTTERCYIGFARTRAPNEASASVCWLESRVRLGRHSSALPLGHKPFSLAAPEKQR